MTTLVELGGNSNQSGGMDVKTRLGRDNLVKALRSSPKGQLHYTREIDSSTPERLVKEIQDCSISDKLVICPIPLPATFEADQIEDKPSPVIATFETQDDDQRFLVDSTFWSIFYARSLLQKIEDERQLEVLAKIKHKLQQHEAKHRALEKAHFNILSSKRLEQRNRDEGFQQAWQAESLKALRAQKEREEKCQNEYNALMDDIKKQQQEEERKKLQEEKSKEESAREEKRKTEEHKNLVNQVYEEHKKFTNFWKLISDAIKSCPDRKQLVPLVSPHLDKLKEAQKGMEEAVTDVKVYSSSRAALGKASNAVKNAEDVQAAVRKYVDQLMVEFNKNKELQAQQQQELAAQQQQKAAQQQAAAQAAAAKGGAQSKSVLPDDLKRYTDLQELLQKHIQTVSPVTNDPTNKKFKFDCEKFVVTPLNTLSAVESVSLRDKFDKLRRLISGQNVMLGENTLNASRHPLGVEFTKGILARKFVQQGEKSVSSNPDSAYVYASLLLGLMCEAEDFRNLVYAYFYKICPYLVPYYPEQQEGQTDEDYYTSLGYTYSNGKVEEHNKFLKRMEGITRLFFSLSVSHLPREVRNKNPQAQHPMSLTSVFKWLSSVVQLSPSLDVTATLIYVVLEVCGARLMQTYPNDMRQVISYMSQKYLPKIKEVTPDAHGGPVTRLEVLLSKILQTGQVPLPRGIISPNFW